MGDLDNQESNFPKDQQNFALETKLTEIEFRELQIIINREKNYLNQPKDGTNYNIKEFKKISESLKIIKPFSSKSKKVKLTK